MPEALSSYRRANALPSNENTEIKKICQCLIETALTDENIPHAERLLEAERRIKDFNHLYFKGAEATRHSIDGLTCHIVADEGNYKLWYEETHSTQRFYLTTKDGQPAFVK